MEAEQLSLFDSKVCIKCGECKDRSAFGRDVRRPDGLFPYCKRCRLKNPEQHDEYITQTQKGLRRCGICKQWLEPSEFYSNRATPSGLHHECKDCSKANVHNWRVKYPDRAKAKDARHYWENREQRQADRRARYEANKEYYRERALRWHKENYSRVRDRKLTYCKLWRARRKANQPPRILGPWSKTNPELKRITYKQWLKRYQQSEHGKIMLAKAKHRRRAAERASPHTLTAEQWTTILELQDYICPMCQRSFDDDLPPTMDHIVPVSKGGGLTFENVQALCRSCNSSKGTKTINYRSTLN